MSEAHNIPTREEFAARVWGLLTDYNGGKPLPVLTSAEEEAAWSLIDAALLYGVGPGDTAAQIVDNWYDAHT